MKIFGWYFKDLDIRLKVLAYAEPVRDWWMAAVSAGNTVVGGSKIGDGSEVFVPVWSSDVGRLVLSSWHQWSQLCAEMSKEVESVVKCCVGVHGEQ